MRSNPCNFSKNSLDPSENTNWTNQISGLIPFSAKLLLKYLNNLSDSKIESLLNKSRESDFVRLKNFCEQYKKLFCYLKLLE